MTLGLVAFAVAVYEIMSWALARENIRRAEGREDSKRANMSDEEIEELGDASPRFVYTV